MHVTSLPQQPYFYPAQQTTYESSVLEQASPLAQSGHLTHSAHFPTHSLSPAAGHLHVEGAVGVSQHPHFPTSPALPDLEALQQSQQSPMCHPLVGMQHSLLQPSLAAALGVSVLPGANSAPVLLPAHQGLAVEASILGNNSHHLLDLLHHPYASTEQQQQQQLPSEHASPELDALESSTLPAWAPTRFCFCSACN